ncbi:family 43 glycosylhydrolase [Tamlana flava]|uniref:family 43 glycosylhydrolase n=1 Tax=Tamlana flava TaxID=3158572 RepID=UPI00351AD12F
MAYSKYYIALVFCFLFSKTIEAQNPIIPSGVYFADPSAKVWNDGKLYVYGSKDESTEYYCSNSYDILSTSDLVNWEVSSNSFSSKGESDQVAYNDAYLYAPDCQYNNGRYYLYYCLSDKNSAEGVATSEKPQGPFTNGVKLDVGGIEEIDPSVFIDDDGQAYYVWGQFNAKIAKLKPNMVEVDTSSIVSNILTENEHYFHEGAFMIKRNGLYYLVYTDISRANRPTCIGYATSKNPTGPYKYQGVIIDNDNSDPSNWNNHGSIVEFNSNWFVFYHRSTHNSSTMRKACIEPIFFNEDGTIDEVEMTTQGAGSPLNAFLKTEAERACLLNGNVRIVLFEQANEMLTAINPSDNVAYKYFDFKGGASSIDMRIKPVNGGTIVIKQDQPWGPTLGSYSIKNDENSEWTAINFPIKPIKGEHAVFISFRGEGKDLLDLDWFKFNE